jgi:mannosyltransferase OCH1-like enzyme
MKKTTNIIPKIMHFIWLNFKRPGTNCEIPRKYKRNIRRWKRGHPDFQIVVWKDSDAENLLQIQYPWFRHTWKNFTSPIYKVDAFRLILMHHCGGFYLDMDTKCRKMNCLEKYTNNNKNNKKKIYLIQKDIVAPLYIENWFLGSVKGEEFWLDVLKEIQSRQLSVMNQKDSFFGTMYCSGPMLLKTVFDRQNFKFKISILNERDVAKQFYHQGDGTWVSLPNAILEFTIIILPCVLLFLLAVWFCFSKNRP